VNTLRKTKSVKIKADNSFITVYGLVGEIEHISIVQKLFDNNPLHLLPPVICLVIKPEDKAHSVSTLGDIVGVMILPESSQTISEHIRSTENTSFQIKLIPWVFFSFCISNGFLCFEPFFQFVDFV